MLFGSSVLPPELVIGGKTVQLGDVVRRAYQDAQVQSIEAWNDIDPIVREFMLVKAIYKMREEEGG